MEELDVCEDDFNELKSVLRSSNTNITDLLNIKSIFSEEIMRSIEKIFQEHNIINNIFSTHKCKFSRKQLHENDCKLIQMEMRLGFLTDIFIDDHLMNQINEEKSEHQILQGKMSMTKRDIYHYVSSLKSNLYKRFHKDNLLHKCTEYRYNDVTKQSCCDILSCHYDWMNANTMKTDKYDQVHPMEMTIFFDDKGNKISFENTTNNINKCGGSIMLQMSQGVHRIPILDDIIFGEMTWIRLEKVFFCPLDNELQGPHNCHKTGCAMMTKEGETFCKLTSLNVINSGLSKCKKKIDDDIVNIKSSYEREQEAKDWFLSFGFDPYSEDKKNRDELEKTEGAMLETFNNLETEDDIINTSKKFRSTAVNRSKEDKKRRKMLHEYVKRYGTEEEKKKEKAGYYSTYIEYEKEAFAIVARLFMIEDKIEKAIGIDIKKAITHASISHNKPQQITFAVEKIERDEKKINIIKKRSHSSTSSASNDNADKRLILITSDNIKKNKEDKIRYYAERGLKFWILIRMHTELGIKRPNNFHFFYFMIAFMFMSKDGYELNSKGFTGGNRIKFFEPDSFLKTCLPSNISDSNNIFGSYNSSNLNALKVMKNIETAITKTITRHGISYKVIHPDENDVMDKLRHNIYPPTVFIKYNKINH